MVYYALVKSVCLETECKLTNTTCPLTDFRLAGHILHKPDHRMAGIKSSKNTLNSMMNLNGCDGTSTIAIAKIVLK